MVTSFCLMILLGVICSCETLFRFLATFSITIKQLLGILCRMCRYATEIFILQDLFLDQTSCESHHNFQRHSIDLNYIHAYQIYLSRSSYKLNPACKKKSKCCNYNPTRLPYIFSHLGYLCLALIQFYLKLHLFL